MFDVRTAGLRQPPPFGLGSAIFVRCLARRLVILLADESLARLVMVVPVPQGRTAVTAYRIAFEMFCAPPYEQ
jgi:hypothetical protein